jgi:hypothetical protein
MARIVLWLFKAGYFPSTPEVAWFKPIVNPEIIKDFVLNTE